MPKILVMSLALGVAITPQAKADPVADFLSGVFSGPAQTSRKARISRRGAGKGPEVELVQRGGPSVVLGHGGKSVMASFYGGGPKKYEPNSHTANGERFNQWALTAAHRTLPFGTRLSVCYRACVIVRINDRGPAVWTGRSLDLSRGAATRIGLVGAGYGLVHVAELD